MGETATSGEAITAYPVTGEGVFVLLLVILAAAVAMGVDITPALLLFFALGDPLTAATCFAPTYQTRKQPCHQTTPEPLITGIDLEDGTAFVVGSQGLGVLLTTAAGESGSWASLVCSTVSFSSVY